LENVSQIYAHIWVIGGDSFYGWQAGGEKCEQVGSTKWSYDLSNLEKSTYISGGLKSGTDYAIIFSADNGLQTFDQTFGTACIGDTAKLTGKQIENAVDSEKKAYESVWKTNSSKYGPHLAISSIGNIIGSKLAPNETGTQVIGDWLFAYYNSQTVDPVATLAKALPKFSVKDIDAVYAYIMSKDSSLDSSALSVMQDQLQQAYKKAYGEEKKVDTKKAETLEKKIKSGSSLSSVSSDSGSGSSSGSSGSSSSGSSSGSTNSSGSGADGQETTIFFILGGIMIMAAAVMVISRKKREE
jgi:LPXTG-motif cell wall-anchored protein